MDQDRTIDIIVSLAKDRQLDPNLCLALAYVETGIDTTKVRYEPLWQYLVNPAKYAKYLGITVETEMQLQRFSWGPMQLMGSNARILGFNGQLVLLVQPQLGVLYALKHLQTLRKKFQSEMDIISAYNQGIPAKINGVYKNIKYVEKVLDRLKYLRGMGG